MQQRVSPRFVAPVLLLVGFTACTPTLEGTFSIGELQGVSSIGLYDRPQVSSVGTFEDARPERQIVEVNDLAAVAAEDVGEVVRRAVQRQLFGSAAVVGSPFGPMISGEILDWQVVATKAFPVSRLNSTAKVRINVLDAGGEVTFSGVYASDVRESIPVLTTSRIRAVLQTAMTSALEEAFKDPDMRKQLSLITGRVVSGVYR